MLKKVIHPFPPVYDENSKILILGSIPSIKSREYGYQYAHPQNRFWKVIGILFDTEITNDNRTQFLLKNGIALWDSIKSCEIDSSSDSSIKNVIPNYEIEDIIKKSRIRKVFTTGSKAYEVYQKYIFPKTKIEAVKLPSTSAANAIKKLDDLVEDYKIIKDYL